MRCGGSGDDFYLLFVAAARFRLFRGLRHQVEYLQTNAVTARHYRILQKESNAGRDLEFDDWGPTYVKQSSPVRHYCQLRTINDSNSGLSRMLSQFRAVLKYLVADFGGARAAANAKRWRTLLGSDLCIVVQLAFAQKWIVTERCLSICHFLNS